MVAGMLQRNDPDRLHHVEMLEAQDKAHLVCQHLLPVNA